MRNRLTFTSVVLGAIFGLSAIYPASESGAQVESLPSVTGDPAIASHTCAEAGRAGRDSCLAETSALCQWSSDLDGYVFALPTHGAWTALVGDYAAPHDSDSTVHDYLVGETLGVWPPQYAWLTEVWGPETGNKSPISALAGEKRSNAFGVWLAAQREAIYNAGTGFGTHYLWKKMNVAGDFLEQEYANLYDGHENWFCFGNGYFAPGGQGNAVSLDPLVTPSDEALALLPGISHCHSSGERCWYPKRYCASQGDQCAFTGGAAVGKDRDENWAYYMGFLGLSSKYPSAYHPSLCDHDRCVDFAPPTGFPLGLVVTADIPPESANKYHWSEQELLDWTRALSVDEAGEGLE